MNAEPAMLMSVKGERMVLQGVAARGSVRGLLFELEVEQRYLNPGATNIEAVYTFPLAVDAVLLDLEVTIGERRLAAHVVERRTAEADYEEAIGNGDTAIMLERAADGLCTLNLGNLMAGEAATIRYRYAQLLRFTQGSVRLTVPTVIAPRYGQASSGGLRIHQAPVSDVAAAYPFSLSIGLYGSIACGAIGSPSHAISTTVEEGGVRVAIGAAAYLDRDFVLDVAGLEGRSLAVVGRDGSGHIALASFCAEAPSPIRSMPIAAKLVVDCSGSMAGDSIAAAKRALHEIVSGLQPADRFSYTRFGSTFQHAGQGLQHATQANVRSVARLVAATDADLGGTEMESALCSVFALGGESADVLLITDGHIWNAESLIETARAARQRVFVVGIGSAPAGATLQRLADATGGACEFVTAGESASAAILRMFARLRAPRISQATITWPGAPAWTTSLTGGLFGGETLHVFAGFDAAPEGAASLTLFADDERRPLHATAPLPPPVDNDRTLARIAASRRLATLDAAQQMALALEYGLLTEHTNLIVVQARAAGEKATGLPALAQVAQMHSAGWGGMGRIGAGHVHSMVGSVLASACFDLLSGTLSSDSEPLCAPLSAPELPRPLDRFIAALEPFGKDPAKPLPASLDALLHLGAPGELITLIRMQVIDSDVETDVVKAVLESLALARTSPLRIAMSRSLQRRLTHLFASGGELGTLRKRVRACVSAWIGRAGVPAAADVAGSA